MFNRLYQWLIDRLSGGEPWTYITRRAAHERPLEVVLVAFFMGLFIGDVLPWRTELIACLLALVGVVAGHIFWGGSRDRK